MRQSASVKWCCALGRAPGTIAWVSTDLALQWRAITAEDGAEWARLVLAIEESYGTEEILGADDLAEFLRYPGVDPEHGTIAVFDQDRMAAYAGLEARPAITGRHEMHLSAGVHPDYRGRGLGSRLLGWAEQAAVPLHRAWHPGHPLALLASCPAGQTDAVALLAAVGYEPARWFHFMSRDLGADLPEAAMPDGIRIVGYSADLSEAARQIRNEAFRDHWGSTETTAQSWQHMVGSEAFRPNFSFVAYRGGDAQGVLIAHDYDAFTAATGRREPYIAIVAVLRAARGRGIASALIRCSLAAAKADDCAAVCLTVDADSATGAVALYERLGFTTLHTSVTHIKQLAEQ